MMHITCWILHLRKTGGKFLGTGRNPSGSVALLDNDIPPRLWTPPLKFKEATFPPVSRVIGFSADDPEAPNLGA